MARRHPEAPVVAVGVLLLDGDRVLLVRRARPPQVGRWTVPGGGVEVGETLREAALRELAEEVGVEAEIFAFVDHVEPIRREDARVREHYVIAVFAARWRRGEATIGPEADAVAWIAPEEIGRFPTTPELPRIIAKAALLERSAR